jgi:hypothetical protein
MARFPETEPDIAALATVMIDGLRKAVEEFPAPPVPPDALQESLDQYNATRTAAVAAESAARDHVALENRALDQLADDMRLDLKYAEVTAKDTPDQLLKLGWGPRRDPRTLELPGVVRDLGTRSGSSRCAASQSVETIRRRRDGESHHAIGSWHVTPPGWGIEAWA